MAKQPENAKEWLSRYEKKYQKAYDNYQATGDPKYDRQVWEYSCICDAFRALIEHKDERNVNISQRITNRDWVIDKLVQPTYTRKEVVKLLHEAVYW